jgi:hypothetical protein
MNFLSELKTEQAEIASEFIDELWHISVFELIPDDCEMVV